MRHVRGLRPRAILGLATAAVAAGSTMLPVQPASACEPYQFPYCTTYCKAIVSRYTLVAGSIEYRTGIDLPGVPRTGLAGCP